MLTVMGDKLKSQMVLNIKNIGGKVIKFQSFSSSCSSLSTTVTDDLSSSSQCLKCNATIESLKKEVEKLEYLAEQQNKMIEEVS